MNSRELQKEINKKDVSMEKWWKTKWNYIMMFIFVAVGGALFALIDVVPGAISTAGLCIAGWYVGNPIGNRRQANMLYDGACKLARQNNMSLPQFAISTLDLDRLEKIKKYSGVARNAYINEFLDDGYINIYQRYVLRTCEISVEDIDDRIEELSKEDGIPTEVLNIRNTKASLEDVLSAFDQDDGINQDSEKPKAEVNSFLSSQLARSMQKTQIMEEAITAELKIYEQIQMYSEHKHIDHETSKRNFENQKYAREKLYNFLSTDEILSSEFSKYSFEDFSNAIDCLRAMGLTFSKNEDYIPIAAFCFKTPLSITIEGFIEEKIDLYTAMVRLLEYFNKE